MAFRKGAEAIQAAATRNSGWKFTPTHRFESGEIKYLQFLTPMDEIFTVLMHRFIIVGQKENGDSKFADFISRRDPNLDGAEGYDPLIDRFGVQPTNRTIGVALEVEPVYGKEGTKKVVTGFEPVMREYTDSEGNDHEVPNIALVVESPFTFYGHLTTFNDIKPIEDVIFAVKRTGKSTDTQYTFIEAGEALSDIDDLVVEFSKEFDLEEYLDELSDEDRMHELIDPLPDDFVVSRYAKKGKKPTGGGKSESTRQRGQSAREQVADDPGDGDEPAEEQPTGETRRRSFAELRQQAKADK